MRKIHLLVITTLLLTSNITFAKNITSTIKLYFDNQAKCPIAFDPHIDNNCKITESAILGGRGAWVICSIESSFMLYYNPNSTYGHDTSLEFHHNLDPVGESYAYTYWMKNYTFAAQLNFKFIPYSNPSIESFILAPNQVVTDDKIDFPGADKLESDTYVVKVSPIIDVESCNIPPSSFN